MERLSKIVVIAFCAALVFTVGHTIGKIEGKKEGYEKSDEHYKKIIERKDVLIDWYEKTLRDCIKTKAWTTN